MNEYIYLNLTPHPLHYLKVKEWESPVILTIPVDGRQVRVEEQVLETSEDGVFDLAELSMGDPEWVPEEQDGFRYIVSRPAAIVLAKLLPERKDFYFPDDFVRNEDGTIRGCKRFARYR